VLDLSTFEALKARAHPAAYAVLISASRNLILTVRGAFRFFGQLVDHAETPEAPRPFDPPPPARSWGAADFPLMRVLPSFKGWNDAQLAELASRTQLLEAPRGHILLGEGQPGGGTIYLVVRGAVEVSTTRPSGRFRHGIRGPGQIFGHEAVSDGGREMFDCTVKESTLLLRLPQQSLDALVKESTPIAGQLLSHLCASVSREFSSDCKHFVKQLAERDLHPDANIEELRGPPSRRSPADS
jgi:hypothetical protein